MLSSMWSLLQNYCQKEMISLFDNAYVLLGAFFGNTDWYIYESWKYLSSLRRVKYKKTSKNICRYFKRRDRSNNTFIVKLKNFTPGVKILEFKPDRKNWNFAKSKNFHESFLRGTNSGG